MTKQRKYVLSSKIERFSELICFAKHFLSIYINYYIDIPYYQNKKINMRKRNSTKLNIFIAFFLTNTFCCVASEKKIIKHSKKPIISFDDTTKRDYSDSLLIELLNIAKKRKITEQNNSATLYNARIPLLSLPQDVLRYIQVLSINSNDFLVKAVQTIPDLQLSCKQFYSIKLSFQYIGENILHHYPQNEKDSLFQKCFKTNGITNMTPLKTILLYAGLEERAVDHCILSELQYATEKDDLEMIATCLKYNCNTAALSSHVPPFFLAKSCQAAQLFINRGTDLSTSTDMYPNVLWYVLDKENSLELLRLYLQHGIDPKKINPSTGDCLLHNLDIASAHYFAGTNRKNFLESAELLLNALPNMINTLNAANKTPLDGFKQQNKNKTISDLITLFKTRGAKTAEELQNK